VGDLGGYYVNADIKNISLIGKSNNIFCNISNCYKISDKKCYASNFLIQKDMLCYNSLWEQCSSNREGMIKGDYKCTNWQWINQNSQQTCTSFTYSAWGECTSSGTQTRNVLTSSPSGCVGGNPVLSQQCTYIPPCTENNWISNITPFVCPSIGKQTKNWTKIGSCDGGVQKNVSEEINCSYKANILTCTKFTYSEWGDCLQSNIRTRTINSSYPYGCSGGNAITSQVCTYVYSGRSGGEGGGEGNNYEELSNTLVNISQNITNLIRYNTNNSVIITGHPYKKQNAIKTLFIKIICRILNLFSDEGYKNCIGKYS
jgi:hypothetical protein